MNTLSHTAPTDRTGETSRLVEQAAIKNAYDALRMHLANCEGTLMQITLDAIKAGKMNAEDVYALVIETNEYANAISKLETKAYKNYQRELEVHRDIRGY